jgi:transposase-like protein
MIGRKWRQNWEQVATLFAFPAAIRRVIYTTNAVEATNRSIRKGECSEFCVSSFGLVN